MALVVYAGLGTADRLFAPGHRIVDPVFVCGIFGGLLLDRVDLA